MIEHTTGDLLAAQVDALVNPVNCAGVMGRGLALGFKRAHPDNFAAYAAACRRGELRPGTMLVFDRGQDRRPRWIVNFPTKRHWRDKSRVEDIASGLVALVEVVRGHRMRSIAVPALGCGLGGLAWPVVRPLIDRAFVGMDDVRVLVFEPG